MQKILVHHSAERTHNLIPSLLPTFYRLRKAYSFAQQYVEGKKVLDLGCGPGYGSYLLALKARKVVGLDKDQAAIYDARKFYQAKNLSFFQADLEKDWPYFNKAEVAIAFQTLEHLKKPVLFLERIEQKLPPKGLLLVSVINKSVNNDGYDCPYHFREYNASELNSLLFPYFKVRLYGVHGDSLVKSYNQARKQKILAFLKVDKLRLKKILPKTLQKYLLCMATPYVRKLIFSQNPSFSQITEKNYYINENLKEALDIIAVCQKI